MRRILKHDQDVLVTLEDGLVKKEVYKVKISGLQKVSAEKAVDKEIRALKILEGVDGIQRFVQRESGNIFYSEYVEGESLFDLKGKLPRAYFGELTEIAEECQRRGVYRFGQNRKDFLVTPDLKPVIIDFGNVLFVDDPIAKVPGIVTLAIKYNYLRLYDLQRRYTR